MIPENYKEETLMIEGWPVNVTSYKLGDHYYCKVDNVSPGAWLSRTQAHSREEAEQKAVEKAQQLLARTKRQPV